eukprot:15145020-Alexandrium_andersonii.AAC.1
MLLRAGLAAGLARGLPESRNCQASATRQRPQPGCTVAPTCGCNCCSGRAGFSQTCCRNNRCTLRLR